MAYVFMTGRQFLSYEILCKYVDIIPVFSATFYVNCNVSFIHNSLEMAKKNGIVTYVTNLPLTTTVTS
jgi:hypothetical protein